MNRPSSYEVTGLLLAWNQGDQTALEKLIPLVHDELRRLAHHYLGGERAGQASSTATSSRKTSCSAFSGHSVRACRRRIRRLFHGG